MSDLLESPIEGISLKSISANGIHMRYAECGENAGGKVVLFCHGWPESWYSWRHQLLALSKAGYHCIAPDMRGYGGTDAPQAIEAYSQLHLVGDMVELMRVLGHSQVVIIGHDWGAQVAWMSALLRPDLFRAVVGMSVPWTPQGKIDLISSLAKSGINNFYMQYFQTPGVAEAEFEADIEESLRRIYYTASGEQEDPSQGFSMLKEGKGFLVSTTNPAQLPEWLPQTDLNYYVAQFQRSGFRGGLNWYRNLKRSWEQLAPWRGQVIHQPSLFIAGERDSVLRFPASQAQIAAYSKTLPGLRGCHILEGGGHWIQRERADEVSGLVIGFLGNLA